MAKGCPTPGRAQARASPALRRPPSPLPPRRRGPRPACPEPPSRGRPRAALGAGWRAGISRPAPGAGQPSPAGPPRRWPGGALGRFGPGGRWGIRPRGAARRLRRVGGSGAGGAGRPLGSLAVQPPSRSPRRPCLEVDEGERSGAAPLWSETAWRLPLWGRLGD